MSASVIGRDPEREQLAGFLSGTGPSLLLITSAAGIGKTTLCRLGVDLAQRQGLRVLAFRPGEAEASLSFTGLSGLISDRLLDEIGPELPAVRRAALETALARDTEASAPVEPGVVGLGVLSVLQTLAAKPLLIAIDDLQWLDAATAFSLDFALRRLDEGPVLLLAAARAEDVAGVAPLEAAFPEARRTRMRLGAMSVGALGRLVQDRLGLALPRLAAVQLAEESGGNPFVALELARVAATRGALPGPGERFQPTSDVVTLLGTRIGRLPDEVRHALELVATAARPDLALLAAVLGEECAESCLTELVAAQLVVVDGSAVRCAHPLVASAAYAGIRPVRLRLVHRQLAEALRDSEERVRHLALATDCPAEEVASALEDAARRAQHRGASTAAAQLGELAVAATPPSDQARLAGRELELARRRLEAGDPPGARVTATRALDRLPPGPGRVDALLLLATIEQEQGEVSQARRWLVRALEEAGSDRAARARAHVAAGMTSWDDVGSERAHAAAAVEALAGHEHEDSSTAATALVLLAGTDFEAGKGLRTELLDRAVELGADAQLPTMMRATTQRAIFLGHAGRLHEALPQIEACLEAAQRQGDQTSQPHLLRTLAWMQLGAGLLHDARTNIERAIALADELALEDPYIWAVAGQVHAALGDVDLAGALCESALTRARAVANPWAEIRALAATGFLHLTVDRPIEAATALVAADAIGAAGQLVEIGWHRMHGDLVEALVAAGESTGAAAAAAAFTERAALTGHPWSIAVSARASGLVEAGRGRFDEAVNSYERALAAPPMAEMPFEQARTLLALGAARRRANRRRDAREALEGGVLAFEAMGSGGGRPGPAPSWAPSPAVPQHARTTSPRCSGGSRRWRPWAGPTPRSPRSCSSRCGRSRPTSPRCTANLAPVPAPSSPHSRLR